MWRILIVFLVGLTLQSFGQEAIDYNTKKGFVANGYDVVAYFNNKSN